MKLKALDQFHISSVSSDSLRPGQEFECSDALAKELLEKHPGKFERAEPAPKNKAERPAQNKGEGGGYQTMTVPQLEAVAKERNIELGDAKKKVDIIAAIELHDEGSAGT